MVVGSIFSFQDSSRLLNNFAVFSNTLTSGGLGTFLPVAVYGGDRLSARVRLALVVYFAVPVRTQ